MKCIARLAPLLLASSCAAAVPSSDVEAKTSVGAPLSEEALRRLFLNGLNTYLTPPETHVHIDHPFYELFRSNGIYTRGSGNDTREGAYSVEGNQLCVVGKGIPKECRKVIRKTANLYLLINPSNNSQALMQVRQVK